MNIAYGISCVNTIFAFMQVLLYNHCECERGHSMEIQTIIKNRRNELGLTLKDVAKALGVSEGTVSRYESSDIQNMGIDKLVPLAKVLKCSRDI